MCSALTSVNNTDASATPSTARQSLSGAHLPERKRQSLQLSPSRYPGRPFNIMTSMSPSVIRNFDAGREGGIAS